MAQVSTPEDIERESKRVIDALYVDVSDFKINTVFPLPEKGQRESWDVKVNFMSQDLKYTVDLVIHEKTGEVPHARLIDTMTPL